jgi:transposase-like protein
VLESYVTKRWDRKASLEFIRKSMKRNRNPEIIVTDRLRSYEGHRQCIANRKQAAG